MRTVVLNSLCLFFALAGCLIAQDRPNILFCISDDQSYAHTGANGDPVVNTPAFDRVAREGLRFTHAFCDAPTCGPSRSAILTGQAIWRLEEAGNIHSTLPKKFATYTELLAKAGYAVGYTGKGWSPGRLEPGGRDINPAGPAFQNRRLKPPFKAMRNTDYAGNFDDFLGKVKQDQPFCFWLGTSEPHRAFQSGAGKLTGKDPAKVVVPPIFPDNDIVRNDILDYLVEVEHFDTMVARAIASLEARGKLDNTIIVVTSDHGMPFPRAKASLYDAGSRVPLAISWPAGIFKPGRTVDAFVNLSDLAPTLLNAAGLEAPEMMTARSLLGLFKGGPLDRPDAAFVAMERHDGCRKGGKGYPCRAIRTADFLYIHNFEPSRWPSGSPDPTVCARAIPYGEIDAAPTKTFMMEHRDEHGVARLAELAFGMRPAEELYDLKTDPHQMVNVAGSVATAETQAALRKRLFDHLRATKDPRVVGGAVDWDYYPYYGVIRTKGWAVDPKPEAESKPRLREVIVSHTDDRGIHQLFRMNEDGTDSVQLTESETGCRMPAVSPDGKMLAYVEAMPGGGLALRMSDIDGMNLQTLVAHGMNRIPSWLPDGKHIVWMKGLTGVASVAPGLADAGSGGKRNGTKVLKPSRPQDPAANSQIHLINTETYESRRLFNDPEQIKFSNAMPSVSPDGKQVAFVSNRSGTFRIWVSDFDGGNARMVSAPPAEQHAVLKLPVEQKVPVWSPDGKWIAHWEGVEMIHMSPFTGVHNPERDQQISATFHVWVVSSDGKERRKVGRGDDPTWSPDGFVTRAFPDPKRGGPKVMVETGSGEKALPIVPRQRNWGRFAWMPE